MLEFSSRRRSSARATAEARIPVQLRGGVSAEWAHISSIDITPPGGDSDPMWLVVGVK